MARLVGTQQLTRDAYLATSGIAQTSADEVLSLIWPSRYIVSRLLEQRQVNARAAGTEFDTKLNQLRGLRRRLDQLLQDTTLKAGDRDTLEREVVAAMPVLKRWQQLDQLGPAGLMKALPLTVVFIDVIRYMHSEKVDNKEANTPKYVAFVLSRSASGFDVRRIELGEANPIDAAVHQWREAMID